jgi:hypothetical protein
MTKVNKAVLCRGLVSSQWSKVKGNDLVLKGQSSVSGDVPLPLRTRQSSETLWPWVCFFVKFKKRLSEVLNNKLIHRPLWTDLLYRKLNWTSQGLEFSFLLNPVSYNITQGLFSLHLSLLHLCLWDTNHLKPLKY